MIRKIQYQPKATAVYPGIYQPPLTVEQESTVLKGSRPPVNVIEYADYYEVEMPAPGFNKDDFLVKAQGCSLLIIGHKKMPCKMSAARYRHHGFHCRYIARNVDLPADADTEFGTAEYKNGILNIYLYKTSCPMENRQNLIFVY